MRGCLKTVTAQRVDDQERGPRRWNLPLWVFLAVEAVLLGIAAFAGSPAGAIAGYLVGFIGGAVFTASVVVRRPRPLVGWSLLGASLWAVVASTVVLAATLGVRDDVGLHSVAPLVVAALVYLPLAAGLAVLSRDAPSAGRVDILDVGMTAMAAFLIFWSFIIVPRIRSDPIVLVGAALSVLGIVLVFAMAVKLGLSGGTSEPATRLVVLAAFALVAAAIIVLLPVVTVRSPSDIGIGRLFYCLFAICLGSAALHPALVRREYPVPERSGSSKGRLGLFSVLAVVPAAAWGMELNRKIDRPQEVGSFLIPIFVSAVLLLLLVARLGLIARVAQERALELARRSTALATAASEQEDLQRQLAYRAMHDPLTGLANRLVFTERMEWALNRRNGTGKHALLLLDLDGFKDVNDTLGHPVGDELLIEVARRLVDVAPPDATLARLGGDEFAVLLEDMEPSEAVEWAERFVTALRQPYRISGRELFLTTSVGVLPIGTVNPLDPGATASASPGLARRPARPHPHQLGHPACVGPRRVRVALPADHGPGHAGHRRGRGADPMGTAQPAVDRAG
jgi:diguanylate cyclase (GGDEF)-like protein